ncbi:MAG: carbamoyl-phosphate synthase large subunit, partial [Candidatus Margulisbacteria bacterium]|nr:carbamoyl-phosphate synthase large subunit [Candidatus Margulisiibacteriota bacterium]
TDKEYQLMRDATIKIMREIGVETGGSNVQFAVNPENGELVVIEMNPRVSRSSALASKATGFPIAKFAAKLAVGYTLDILLNAITKKTPACFEPALDYCVVKIPRFNFEKFPQTKPHLGTSMMAVGEVMAIGRTFKEALQKGIRSLEIDRFGLGFDGKEIPNLSDEDCNKMMSSPNPFRLFYIKQALDSDRSIEDIYNITKIDKWFLYQLKQIVDFAKIMTFDAESIRKAKVYGFSDPQIARILGKKSDADIRAFREKNGIRPTYSLVDTCAAEFEAETPYYYSTYETTSEGQISHKQKVMILGSGPNRIGQGIEFDYCCVHASMMLREDGFESIMVNSNPETVSTDFDISDKLYFEPITFEDVLNIYEREKPLGVIIQFGGQTPLNLATKLENAGVKILGTSTKSIHLAEDREKFQKLLHQLSLLQPQNGTALSVEESIVIANTLSYPVVVRPSFVLGGASMEIVYNQKQLEQYITKAKEVSPEHPILIDKYLEHAKEIDVDALSDGTDCIIAGIMEHVEEAGIHSGDSACSLPPYTLGEPMIQEIRLSTKKLAKALNIVGLLNIQFAVKDDTLYVIEVNPRASRTVPFVSKATGIPWAKKATQILMGKIISDLNLTEVVPTHFSVKEATLPFNRFRGADILLSPEMKSTGESMGIAATFPLAFHKAQTAVGQYLPTSGTVFVSVSDSHKSALIPTVKALINKGFSIVATHGTADIFEMNHLAVTRINKISEGGKTVMDLIMNCEIKLAFITTSFKTVEADEVKIRQQLLVQHVPYVTTLPGIHATVDAINTFDPTKIEVKSLQEYFK